MPLAIAALLTLLSPSPGDLFGASLAYLGPLDGDGLDAFAVGAPFDGSVRVFSGRGEPLNTLWGDAADWFGDRVAAFDDLDGDGRSELAILAGRRPSRILIVDPLASSLEGAVLVGDGRALGAFTCVGDVDGDGLADLAVLSSAQDSMDLLVFSGGDGSPLAAIPLCSDGGGSGSGCLVRATDRDGDGVDDVWVGLDELSPPRALLVSLGSGEVLAELRPEWKGQKRFGTHLAILGDVDGDGRPDLAVVEPNETARWPTPYRIGAITVFSDGSRRLYRIRDSDARRGISRSDWRSRHREFSAAILPVDDLDGDGLGDLVVSDSGGFGGAFLHSGKDGGLIREWVDDGSRGFGFACDVALLGDVDGDGHRDLAIGRASSGSPRVPGSVHAFSIADGRELFELRLAGPVR
jgi:hypothetical protein